MWKAPSVDEAMAAEEWKALYSLGDFISGDPACDELKRRVEKCATTSSPVLVIGESGTGKELIAHSLHRLSTRSRGPFVRVNCAAIPKELLEAELFGYEPGAFTGAGPRGGIGKVELSDGGTLFLDEISDMTLELQPKLLRVLQEKEIVRVGGRYPKRVDFRLVTATNKAIPQLMRRGQFREDLYYRLNVLRVWIPPLRTRPGDIVLLAEHFLRLAAEEAGCTSPQLTSQALAVLGKLPWPGNVRELQSVMTRLAILVDGAKIDAQDLLYWSREIESETAEPSAVVCYLKTIRSRTELVAIDRAIRAAGGNKTKAAQLLGIPRSVLYHRLKVLVGGYAEEKHADHELDPGGLALGALVTHSDEAGPEWHAPVSV